MTDWLVLFHLLSPVPSGKPDRLYTDLFSLVRLQTATRAVHAEIPIFDRDLPFKGGK
jgi:hypothetical protein